MVTPVLVINCAWAPLVVGGNIQKLQTQARPKVVITRDGTLRFVCFRPPPPNTHCASVAYLYRVPWCGRRDREIYRQRSLVAVNARGSIALFHCPSSSRRSGRSIVHWYVMLFGGMWASGRYHASSANARRYHHTSTHTHLLHHDPGICCH
jgi:hypothetical protein